MPFISIIFLLPSETVEGQDYNLTLKKDAPPRPFGPRHHPSGGPFRGRGRDPVT